VTISMWVRGVWCGKADGTWWQCASWCSSCCLRHSKRPCPPARRHASFPPSPPSSPPPCLLLALPHLPCLPCPAPQEAVEAVEIAAKTLAAPQERLKRLLEAKDKKAVLLEMAGGWVGGWAGGRVGSYWAVWLQARGAGAAACWCRCYCRCCPLLLPACWRRLLLPAGVPGAGAC
jgi:hypothetical protein